MLDRSTLIRALRLEQAIAAEPREPTIRRLTDDEVASVRDESRAWRSAIGERFAAIERCP